MLSPLCAVVLLQLDREVVVLLVAVGVYIEYHQVLLAPVRQLGRFAVEVEHFDIVHFARQFLCCGCGCREREGRQHRDYFHLHYILFFGFK